MNQAISHACITLWWYSNQEILNPANEALHEECLPASLSQLVPPSCRLLLPSGAQGAPHHLKAFVQAPPSVGLLPPLLPSFLWLLSSPFLRVLPWVSGWTRLLCFPHVQLAHVMFHMVYQRVHLTSVFLTRLEAPWWQEAICLLTSVDAVPAHRGTWETHMDRMKDLVVYEQLPVLRAPLPRVWSLGSRMFQNGIPDSVSVPGAALRVCVILQKRLHFSSTSSFLISKDGDKVLPNALLHWAAMRIQ